MNTEVCSRALRRALVVALFSLASSPLTAQTDDIEVDLFGEVRVRTEVDARTSDEGTDHATLLRTRLGAEVRVGEEASALIQFSDSRAFGEEENTLTDASADQFDLHQAYVDWTPDERVRVRAGRQELAFADQRLVGTVGWANVTRTFDGIRATVEPGEWTIDAFATILDEKDALLATGLDPRQNEGDDEDRAFYGVWGKVKPVEVFALFDRNAVEGTRTNIDRYTLGGHLRGATGPVRGQLTAAWQGGEQTTEEPRRQDIEAYLFSARVDVDAPGSLKPRFGGQIDVVSGDDSPADEDFGAFSTLYATNHAFYGFMDFFLNVPGQTGGLGLVDLVARGGIRPNGWNLGADLHWLWLQEEREDGERGIGVELDLTVRRQVADGLNVQFGYSVFNASDGGETPPVGLGDDVLHWAYFMTTFGFQAPIR